MKTTKIIAIVFIAILVINITLLALRVIKESVFWTVIAISFIVSYIIKRRDERKK